MFPAHYFVVQVKHLPALFAAVNSSNSQAAQSGEVSVVVGSIHSPGGHHGDDLFVTLPSSTTIEESDFFSQEKRILLDPTCSR